MSEPITGDPIYTEQRRNLASNPAARNLTGYDYYGGAGATAALSAVSGTTGPVGLTTCARMSWSVAPTSGTPYLGYGRSVTGYDIPVEAGVTYNLSGYVRVTGLANAYTWAHVVWWSDTGAYLTEEGGGFGTRFPAPAGTWVRPQYTTAPAPANAARATLRVYLGAQSGSIVVPVSATLDFTGLLMERTQVLSAYFDGNFSPDPNLLPFWLGIPDASPSILNSVIYATEPVPVDESPEEIRSNAWQGYSEPEDDSSRTGVSPFGFTQSRPLKAPDYNSVASEPGVVTYLYGHREEWFRYDILDYKLNLIGQLDAALTGGQLEFNIYNDIRGTGSLSTVKYSATYTAEDPYPDAVDWMNHLIRITYCTPLFEVALLTGIPQAPTDAYSDQVVTVEVELYDKTLKLQEDTYGYAYTVKAGTPILAKVKEIIASVDKTSEVVAEDSALTLKDATVWDAGTTKLRIVNDLLDKAGFYAIYCDGYGRYKAQRRKSMKDRPVDWTFEYGKDTGLYLPEFKATTDRFDIPNKFIGVGVPPKPPKKKKGKKQQKAGPAPVMYAYDTDPDSPFSYSARGNRWITKSETDMKWNTVAELQTTVIQRLEDAQAVSANLEDLQHPWLPFGMNSIVVFHNPKMASTVRSVCQAQSINLYPGGLCTSTLRGLSGLS